MAQLNGTDDWKYFAGGCPSSADTDTDPNMKSLLCRENFSPLHSLVGYDLFIYLFILSRQINIWAETREREKRRKKLLSFWHRVSCCFLEMLNSSMFCCAWDFHDWPPEPAHRHTRLLYLFIHSFLNARPECHRSSDPLRFRATHEVRRVGERWASLR